MRENTSASSSQFRTICTGEGRKFQSSETHNAILLFGFSSRQRHMPGSRPYRLLMQGQAQQEAKARLREAQHYAYGFWRACKLRAAS
jgi:hypothetical protein